MPIPCKPWNLVDMTSAIGAGACELRMDPADEASRPPAPAPTEDSESAEIFGKDEVSGRPLATDARDGWRSDDRVGEWTERFLWWGWWEAESEGEMLGAMVGEVMGIGDEM